MSRAAAMGVLVVFGFAPIVRAADAIQIVTAARAVQPGEVVLFTATAEAPIDALRARAFDRDLPTFRRDSRTWQVVLGIDLDIHAGSYPVSFEALVDQHTVDTTITLAVQRRVFPTRTLRVDDAFVNPPAPVLQRITSEAADLAHVWTESAHSRLWSDAFVRPVPGRAISSFGMRLSPL